jgi:choline-glycine betaine transporter
VLFLLTLFRFGIIGLNIDVMTIILNLIAIAITLGSLTKAFTRPYSISKTIWGAVSIVGLVSHDESLYHYSSDTGISH